MRVVDRHAEDRRHVGGGQLVPQGQLDDLPVPVAEPRGSRVHQLADLRDAYALGEVDGVGGRFGNLGGPLPPARPQLAQALVPRDRVQPREQPVRVAQLARPLPGEDERVLHDVGRRLPVAQQAPAVRVQPGRVAAVRRVEAARVSGDQRGHDGPIVHAGRVGPPCTPDGQTMSPPMYSAMSVAWSSGSLSSSRLIMTATTVSSSG